MILDQKVSGITCMEFNAQKKGTLLEPYAIIMWNAMNEVQFNAEQEKYVVEVRDLVVKNLESLLELLNIAVLFDEKKLKKVQLEKLGDGYCSEISNSMIKIIQESLEGYQKVINDNKVHAFEQDVAYVANFLEIMPTPESFVIDEETGRISRAVLPIFQVLVCYPSIRPSQQRRPPDKSPSNSMERSAAATRYIKVSAIRKKW